LPTTPTKIVSKLPSPTFTASAAQTRLCATTTVARFPSELHVAADDFIVAVIGVAVVMGAASSRQLDTRSHVACAAGYPPPPTHTPLLSFPPTHPLYVFYPPPPHLSSSPFLPHDRRLSFSPLCGVLFQLPHFPLHSALILITEYATFSRCAASLGAVRSPLSCNSCKADGPVFRRHFYLRSSRAQAHSASSLGLNSHIDTGAHSLLYKHSLSLTQTLTLFYKDDHSL
jgi:hypothetical protein